MKNKLYLLAALVCMFLESSCKKDMQLQIVKQQKNNTSLEGGLLSFSVNGQLINANIDTSYNTITVTVPSSLNQHTLTVNFTLASQVSAIINNTIINSGTILDLSAPISFTVLSADNSHSTSFKIIAQTELGYFGLPGTITAQNSLNKNYEYYFDQFDGSTFQYINCGPSSTTMAIKWADSAFTGKPIDARNLFLPQGGWWDTGQIQGYLFENGINSVIDTLSNLNDLVKNTIDKNNVLILNPDMNYIPYNENFSQHVNKFYITTPGWGHYFLVKGYKQIGNTFYLEVYDPYSEGLRYSIISVGQFYGKDRYYNSDDVRVATKNWWPYAIIIAPKGLKVLASTHFKLNAFGRRNAIPISYGK